VPDCDTPGWSYAKKVVFALVGVATSLRVLDLELPFDGDDAYEFVMDGNTKDDLIKRVKDAPQILTVDDFVIPQRYVVDSVDSGMQLDEDGVPPLEVAREDVVDVEEDPVPSSRFVFEEFNSIKTEPLEWLIKGVIPQNSFVALYAPPASFKSFVALDMSYAIAAREKWMGMDVSQDPDGCVLYIAAEGHGGLGSRLSALKCNYKLGDDSNTPIFFLKSQLNLTSNEKDFDELVVSINYVHKVRRKNIRLIVIDTLARTFVGNENDSLPMGMFINKVGQLMTTFKCAAMVVHHTGKDISRGLRGHSSLLGAVDTELEITRSNFVPQKALNGEPVDDVVGKAKLVVTKQKDGEDSTEFLFEMVKVNITKDSSNAINLVQSYSLAVRPMSEEGRKSFEDERNKPKKSCLFYLKALVDGKNTARSSLCP
jgi:hypothetical protein